MGSLTLRLDDELHEKLRLHRAFTGQAANDLISGLVREFFEGQGGARLADAVAEHAKRSHGKALTELGEA